MEINVNERSLEHTYIEVMSPIMIENFPWCTDVLVRSIENGDCQDAFLDFPSLFVLIFLSLLWFDIPYFFHIFVAFSFVALGLFVCNFQTIYCYLKFKTPRPPFEVIFISRLIVVLGIFI